MPDLFHDNEVDGVDYDVYRNFSAADLASFDVRQFATNDSVTLTPTATGVAMGGPPSALFRMTSNGADPTLNGNHREFFLRSDRNFENSEISSVFYGGGTWSDVNNRTQQGHVHRYQKLGNGRFRAYVAWHDMVAGLPTTINVGVWEGDGSVNGLTLFSTNAILVQSPIPVYAVTTGSITTNVASITVPYGVGNYHQFRDGDLVDVTMANSALNVNDVRLTLAFGTLMTYPKVNADVAATAAGAGIITKQGPQSDFPYVFKSRLLPGDILQAKLYRLGDPEIPWSLASTGNNAVYTLSSQLQDHVHPRGPGLSGVMVGHVSGGEYVQFGRPHIRQI